MAYDVIIIGGGHAGCEAALASAKIGAKTVLLTASIPSIALTPCNPSIGGPAKGIVVREIDALGGYMGINSDLTMLQIKMLNRSKGPAVHSLRAQVDKVLYPKKMQEKILSTSNLVTLECMVDSLIFNKNNTKVIGVLLEDGKKILASKVVVTAGTYLNSYILKGDQSISAGPDNLPTTKNLSKSLKDIGIDLFRLKTGTPARILAKSIDFSQAQITYGDEEPLAFSFYHPKYLKEPLKTPCYLIHTNKQTHDIIKTNLTKSAMYSGVITGVGPRYCPSIEDKLFRFKDKERHQLFLEPESEFLDTIYLQGFSTSMPDDIQDEMIHSLIGLENAVVEKYGYAIEYDAIKPEQLKVTLECKKIDSLYFAGQINGTSGYEEAAGQGLVAGANAALSFLNKEPLILSRTNSYIGLMIDDLIVKGTEEPYRLLTSRSEYRLYLRNDNADIRLSQIGYDIGLLGEEEYQLFSSRLKDRNELLDSLRKTTLSPKVLTKDMAKKFNTEPLSHGINACDFLKRPEIDYLKIKEILKLEFDNNTLKQVEIEVKYEGYIKKVVEQMGRSDKLYKIKIPIDIDYLQVANLALEAREKLNKFKPETIGHVSSISGINPADVSALQIHLEQKRRINELSKHNNIF